MADLARKLRSLTHLCVMCCRLEISREESLYRALLIKAVKKMYLGKGNKYCST